MADEQTEKMVRLLEEIRDLTKERNEKLEKLVQTTRKRYEEALQRQKEARARALLRRRQFLWILTPLLLLAIGFMAYLAFWAIPKSEQKEAEHWMQQMQIMQSNQLIQPH